MSLIQVPVTKGKGFVEIDTDKLPQHVYEAFLAEGAKHFVNGSMTKITVAKLQGQDLEDAKAAAMTQAAKNVENIMAGKIRIVGAKAEKTSGAVNTEAMRLARNRVKDELKRQGFRVSHYPASEITLAAKALIAAEPEILAEAKASMEARSHAKPVSIDVKALKPSDKLIKAAEAKKAKDKAPLSASKAGKTAKHKPQAKAQPVQQANA